ncbi:hypothetical protein [Jiangella endophytica]|uniref:hypothetical protein n=1 Tax=Jiangella endophytica TaxID=1623398 RepID=UPI000E341ED6|nr:hypothetical protein [Jiangella endophytica]
MDALSMILGILFVVLLSSGGWIVWGVVQTRQRARELAIAREREETERLRLRLEAEDRLQERADRIYLDSVRRHTDQEPPRELG